MSFSQPNGYRISRSVSLTGLSRVVVHHGRMKRRDAAVHIIASVLAELVRERDNPDAVFGRRSHGQILSSDLVVSSKRGSGLLRQAAEFVDQLHAVTHRPSAIPIPPQLDLRFTIQFFDDRHDPDRTWTYVLVGTEQARLENSWREVRGVQPYPVANAADPPADIDFDPEWSERCAVWERVLRPYRFETPLCWQASDPQLLFDIVESLLHPEREAELAEEGRPTATMVMEETRRLLGDAAMPELEALVTRPIGELQEQPI